MTYVLGEWNCGSRCKNLRPAKKFVAPVYNLITQNKKSPFSRLISKKRPFKNSALLILTSKQIFILKTPLFDVDLKKTKPRSRHLARGIIALSEIGPPAKSLRTPGIDGSRRDDHCLFSVSLSDSIDLCTGN